MSRDPGSVSQASWAERAFDAGKRDQGRHRRGALPGRALPGARRDGRGPRGGPGRLRGPLRAQVPPAPARAQRQDHRADPPGGAHPARAPPPQRGAGPRDRGPRRRPDLDGDGPARGPHPRRGEAERSASSRSPGRWAWVARSPSGLAAVHAYAVHRDVKPDNVHLGNDGTVRVLDLGAGKFHRSLMVTTADRALGTVPYMSPEQLSINAAVDGRSDVFSLGTLLVELISGVHPFAPEGFANENIFTLVRRIVSDAPVSLAALAPWVPAFVAATIDKALARAVDARHRERRRLRGRARSRHRTPGTRGGSQRAPPDAGETPERRRWPARTPRSRHGAGAGGRARAGSTCRRRSGLPPDRRRRGRHERDGAESLSALFERPARCYS